MEVGGDVMEAGKTGSQELTRGYNIDEGRDNFVRRTDSGFQEYNIQWKHSKRTQNTGWAPRVLRPVHGGREISCNPKSQ